jgi:hypothetical protein
MAIATSDVDRVGVYVADTRKVLGLDCAKVVSDSQVTHEPDLTLHEIGKFVSLALKCNPTVLELLYATTYDVCNEVGAELVSIRSSFLCENAIRGAYGGYAVSQLRKIVDKSSKEDGDEAGRAKRIEKQARHCFRLLRSGQQLLTTGEIVLNVGDDRDEIFSMGELAVTNLEEFKTRFEAALATFESMESAVGKHRDQAKAEKFIVRTRINALRV